jgi:hypothetical protein
MKHLLSALVLIALLASPVAAQSSRYVGTWLVGAGGPDWVKVLKLKVRDEHNVGWGSAVATGYAPFMELRKADTGVLFATVSGAWADSTEKDALFALGQATCLAPASGYQDYEAYLVLSKAGSRAYLSADDEAAVFLVRIKRWP